MTDEKTPKDEAAFMAPPPKTTEQLLVERLEGLAQQHALHQQELANLRAALDQQGQQTQAGLRETAQATVERALQLALRQPVSAAGPLHAPRLRVVVPDGSPALDVLSLVAWLSQQLVFTVGQPASLNVPVHLKRYFTEVPEHQVDHKATVP